MLSRQYKPDQAIAKPITKNTYSVYEENHATLLRFTHFDTGLFMRDFTTTRSAGLHKKKRKSAAFNASIMRLSSAFGACCCAVSRRSSWCARSVDRWKTCHGPRLRLIAAATVWEVSELVRSQQLLK